jgi:hypothetical protein
LLSKLRCSSGITSATSVSSTLAPTAANMRTKVHVSAVLAYGKACEHKLAAQHMHRWQRAQQHSQRCTDYNCMMARSSAAKHTHMEFRLNHSAAVECVACCPFAAAVASAHCVHPLPSLSRPAYECKGQACQPHTCQPHACCCCCCSCYCYFCFYYCRCCPPMSAKASPASHMPAAVTSAAVTSAVTAAVTAHL